MLAILTISKGSEAPAIALARYEAWLAGEACFQHSEIQRRIEERNEARAQLNDGPEEERELVNHHRVAAGESPHVWPLEPLLVPPWEDRFHDQWRCEWAKQACEMTQEEREVLRAGFSAHCGKMDSDEFQKVQHMLGAWENGESARNRRERVAEARRKADAIIAKRSHIPDIEGLDFSECWNGFGPMGSNLEGYEQHWQSLDDAGREQESRVWEFHERRLPVYYEYARQSLHLLTLAAIHEFIENEMPGRYDEDDTDDHEPSIRGSPMHPLDFTLRKGTEALHAVTGGFADGVLALSRYLVQDVPYPLIPLQDRKRAALHACRCNQSHFMSGPWLSDPGDVRDPWVQGMVSRDFVRLATWEEATQKASIDYSCTVNKPEVNQHYCHKDIIEYPDALNATTSDGKKTLPDGRLVYSRTLDDEGCEIMAIRLRWKDSLNSELVDAFRELIDRMRPRHPPEGEPHPSWPIADWPERPDERKGKGKDTEIDRALNALIKLRLKRAIEIADKTPRKDDELRRRRELLERLPELKRRLSELKWRADDKAVATACFKTAHL